MPHRSPDTAPTTLNWNGLDRDIFAEETAVVAELLAEAPLTGEARVRVAQAARDIVTRARAQTKRKGVMESFLEEFGLANQEGLALMCLAEALLRIPDTDTVDRLIAEKISGGDWEEHAGKSDHWLVNASTWGLMLTGKLVTPPAGERADLATFVRQLVQKSGEPVIRAATMQAMRIMGEQFVVGRTIRAALDRGGRMVRKGEAASFSFDMLGEGARTFADANRYFAAYRDAIAAVGAAATGQGPEAASGISVKLSALHPRYWPTHAGDVHRDLYPMVLTLAEDARKHDIGFCLDAEESERLVLSLELLERLAAEPSLKGWNGLGLAVQAYQKRVRGVIDRLATLAQTTERRLMVRLVKGAYWDAEVKRAQQDGKPDYPVFTTKAATDLSYLCAAKHMLAHPGQIYPQFATHNAHTVAAIREMGADHPGYEFQRLHGMGEALYRAAGEARVRVYAPVGAHEDLLPYLVRRLLENGANTSFVHSFLDDDVPVEAVAADPITAVEAGPRRHARIPTPPELYGPNRRNAAGFDLAQAGPVALIAAELRRQTAEGSLSIGPIVRGRSFAGPGAVVRNPARTEEVIATLSEAGEDTHDQAVTHAMLAQPDWDRQGGPARAAILRRAADQLEADTVRFMALAVREAGKTLSDAVAEVREAIDFLRYYAAQAEVEFAGPQRLPGPAGETNHLSLHGRGVFACISPWNFPLAIFTGQVAAALAAGNAVLAKPAEQTPLIAHEMVRLLHAAGVPGDILAFLPGRGETVGARLSADPRIAGVCFTGSTEVARIINRTLASRDGPIPVLIAETGGLNGLFVDTTALKEQVVDDVIQSAFGSAGQRCSALRVVFLPHDTADAILETLKGALATRRIGDPARPDTDIGPVIDAEALAGLEAHVAAMRATQSVSFELPLPPEHAASGTFMAPTLIELDSIEALTREVFGPILHVVRYDPDQVGEVGRALAKRGYGLTLGVHTRLESFRDRVRAAVPAGNCYVNRSIIGAVVGVQPFGGEGLSGTGPKAGGPHYLHRFATERVLTINVAAQGGDPELLSL